MFELTSWTYCRDNSAFELGKGAFVAPWILHNASTYKWGTLGHIEVLHSGRCTTRSTSVLLRSTRSVAETDIENKIVSTCSEHLRSLCGSKIDPSYAHGQVPILWRRTIVSHTTR